jgi:multiple sugar transport system substrate-binding protein
MLMKEIMAVSNPDILLEGASDGGVNGTPDEVAFAAERVGYYHKYFNAPLRMAQNWDDPTLCTWANCRSSPTARARPCSGRRAAALFKHGKNKEQAAEYIRALTYDQQIWRDSIEGTESGHPGQLPPYKSIYAEWDANPPDWMPPFVGLVRGQLDRPRRSPTTSSACSSSSSASRSGRSYLKGEEANPRVAMQAVVEAVQAEMKRG